MEENRDINNHTEKRGNDVEMMRRWCEKVRSVLKVSEASLECKMSVHWRKHRSEGKNIGEASEHAVAIGEGSGVITCLSRYITSLLNFRDPEYFFVLSILTLGL